jgi:hypothetical protein
VRRHCAATDQPFEEAIEDAKREGNLCEDGRALAAGDARLRPKLYAGGPFEVRMPGR